MQKVTRAILLLCVATVAWAQGGRGGYSPATGGSSGSGSASDLTTGTLNAARLPSTFSIPGPITLTGPGAGTEMYGCAAQTVPALPANAVGIIGPTSCTGQHVLAPPATGATGSTQVLMPTGAEDIHGVTQTQWGTPAGGGTTTTYSLPYVQFGSASYASSQDTVPAGTWSWVNQGTSTLTTTAGGALHIIWTAEALNHARGYVQNVPGSTYTMKVHCSEGFVQGCGLFLFDGTKCRTFFLGTDNKLHIFSYATASTVAGGVFTSGLTGVFPTNMWWKLVEDGTHRTFSISTYDGDYQTILQELTNAGLTPTQVGVGTDDSFSGLAAAPDAFVLSFALTTP